ncbi:TPA: AAA family ATPase [Escherichia coli]|nr:AAA family ATPase [Escherichia coli]
MGIKSIRIKNILSFDDVYIDSFEDFNLIIGRNNSGKSNLLKVFKYFYEKLDEQRSIPLTLNSNYTPSGIITITYDTTRIKKIVTSTNNNSRFHKHIYNTLFKEPNKNKFTALFAPERKKQNSEYSLTLTISNDDSISWSTKDKKLLSLIKIIFPFFYIDTRRMVLYNWEDIWRIISSINSFNFQKISEDEILKFLDENISSRDGDYKKYITRITDVIDTKPYTYKEKVINYIKIALKGHIFTNSGEDILHQSDGTNSHKYIETIIKLLISLSRTEFITPTIYIDEPEIGLHPKLGEQFITTIHTTYNRYKKSVPEKESGKYSTPYPCLIFSTHAPNILKQTIKLFSTDQQILHFSKKNKHSTKISKLNSQYSDLRFINMFSDNEARLFFSEYILFVEGSTEMEVFQNSSLARIYPDLGRIDIYASDDVMLRNINPTYSQAAIPFLIVKDIDKVIKLDYKNEILSLDGDVSLVNKLIRKGSLKFYNPSLIKKIDSAKEIIRADKSKKEMSVDGLFFKTFKIENFVRDFNKLLKSFNLNYMTTTIEGALINEHSLKYFYRWICHIVFNQLDVNNENPKKMFAGLMRTYNLKDGAISILNSAFVLSTHLSILDPVEQKLVFKVKKRALFLIKKSIKGDFKNNKEITTLFRLLFGGKTATLISLEMNLKKSCQRIDPSITATIKKYKSNELKFLLPYTTKTSGWVTSFLDFTIAKLEQENADKIAENLRFLFPEIISIIEQASSSIDIGEFH